MPLHSTTLRTGTEDSGNREGEVHEKHDGLRAQKRPLPGTRPEPLAEVSEPQGPAATVGYVAARPPLIWWGPKLLADSSAEVIDGRTLRYLLKKNLARKEEEEEEEERRRTQQETSQLQQIGPLAGAASSSRSVRRKRKKRSKKKLPKAPLSRCGRPCALQRQVPAVESALSFRSSTTCGHSCCAAETGTHSVLHSPGAVLGQGRCARVVQRQVRDFMVQKTVLVPQLQFIEGRRPPFVPQRQIPMVLPVCGDSAPRAVLLRGFQALMRSMICRRAQNCGNSALAVHHGRRHSLRGAEADPHGPDYSAVP